MYYRKEQHAWRTDEQLIDEMLCRAFRETPAEDDRFTSLLKKISAASGRQDRKSIQ